MSSNSTIKTGLLAYGMSGKVFHAPFLAAHPGFELAAVVERSKKLATTDYPDIKSYDSIAQILDDQEIELVVVNTPNYLHYEHCKAALNAGKHVLVEKPFAATSAEASELFALGAAKGLAVMVYQNRRYSSDYLSTLKVIKSGKLGKITEAHFRFDRYRPAIGPKAFKEQPYPASGILYDLGAHLIDQVINCFGMPDRWEKVSGIYRDGGQTDDFGQLHFIYDQTHVFVTVSLLTANPLPAIVIHGKNGSFIKQFADTQEDQSIAGIKPDDPQFGMENPGMEGTLTLVATDGKPTTTLIKGEKGDMMGIFEAAFQTIRNGKSFPVQPEQIIKQLEILEG